MISNTEGRFFERNMPKIGFFLNIITSVASGIVDLTAARIISKSSGAGLAAGVLGAVSGVAVDCLIFLFSNVQQDYKKAGKAIDNTLSKHKGFVPLSDEKEVALNKTSYHVIFAQLGLSGMVLTTTILDSVSQYQEIQSLAISAREQGMVFSSESAIWLGIFLAIMNGTSEFFICNSFANLAITRMMVKDSEQKSDRGFGKNSGEIVDNPLHNIHEFEESAYNTSMATIK